MKRRSLLSASFGLLAYAAAPAASPTDSDPAPVEMTDEQDHQRMMNLLDIKYMRPARNGNNPDSPNYANYDESKANVFPVRPDPLFTNGREKVTTPEMWWNVRRPEIVEQFDREVYGRTPEVTPAVSWEVTETTNSVVGDTPVVTRRLTGHVDNSSYSQITVEIDALVTTPANASGPVPVIMQFGFTRPLPRRAGAPARAAPPRAEPQGPTWQEQIIARGWGYAVIAPNSVQADNGAGLTKGIIGLVNKGQPRKPDDWGALKAWAWGASRLLDYFETDDAVDAMRVGIQGHSRYGKATAVAMAYDNRFAVAFVSSSGSGGLSLYRRDWGEIVENTAGLGAYHWMGGNFLKYAGPLTWDDLPIDTHELVALIAPRPVFIGTGSPPGDAWVDPKGMFLAGVYAGPVYTLLGKKGLGTTEYPPVETTLIEGDIGFRQHAEGHTPGPNWPAFLEFVARYFEQ